MEQLCVALLLFRRCIPPKSPQGEACHAINVDAAVDDLHQLGVFLAIALLPVNDTHKPVARRMLWPYRPLLERALNDSADAVASSAAIVGADSARRFVMACTPWSVAPRWKQLNA